MKVLLADDDVGIRTVLRINMERRGWTVVLAEDGEQALREASGGAYDAIVLDQRMPGLTGLEVAGRLAATAAPIFLFSAYLDDDLRRTAVELGCTTVEKGDTRELMALLERRAGAIA